MKKKRVLFICEHNSARSQMAEAFLKEQIKTKISQWLHELEEDA